MGIMAVNFRSKRTTADRVMYIDLTDLYGAILRNARGLTQEQISSAITDEDTRLPDYLKPPAEPNA